MPQPWARPPLSPICLRTQQELEEAHQGGSSRVGEGNLLEPLLCFWAG